MAEWPDFPSDDIPSGLKNDKFGSANPALVPRPPSAPRISTHRITESVPAVVCVSNDEQEIDELMEDGNSTMGLEDASARLQLAPSVPETDPRTPPRPKRQRMEVYVDIPPLPPPRHAPSSVARTSRARSKGETPPKKSTYIKPHRAGDLRHICVDENSKVDTTMLPSWDDQVR